MDIAGSGSIVGFVTGITVEGELGD